MGLEYTSQENMGGNMRILITGADGMLGADIQNHFGTEELITTDIHNLDERYWADVEKWKDKNLSLIVHLAAETDLEYCQQNQEMAYWTNTTGTIHMCRLADELKIPLVYISTAGIFDGKEAQYSDDDEPMPINVYGRSKYYGELAVKQLNKYYVFRAGWMMGGGPEKDKKFVNKVISATKDNKGTLFAIDDIWGSPTYTWDLAKTIKNCISNSISYGVYNCVGEGRASRYDVAKKIIEYLELENVVIEPVGGIHFDNDYSCPRPKSEVLINDRLSAWIPNVCSMRPWQDSLKEYLERYYV